MVTDENPSTPTSPHTHSLIVGEAQAGQRLDRFLAENIANLSRSRIKSFILDGLVHIDGDPDTSPADKVHAGETIELEEPPVVDLALVPEPIPIDIVYEDVDLIVINKQAGLVMHPGAGNETGTLVQGLLAHCGANLSGIGGVRRPGIVHRIDKETSGLIVVAKNDAAHEGLTRQFANHSIERLYKAITLGVVPASGTIDANIGRDPADRKKMSVRQTGTGKSAVTHFKRIKAFGKAACLIDCQLETGRTHQIRVHLAHLGYPLIGDPVYTRMTKTRASKFPEPVLLKASAFGRQALHAAVLGFIHPRSGEKFRFTSEMPEDMASLVNDLESIEI